MTFSSDKSAPASGDTKKVLRLYYDDSAVDGIEFSQDPTTGAITVAPLGSGDNLDIVFGGKGTGAPKVGAEVVENQGNKGQSDGYASLDSGGLVPSAELGSGTPDGTTFLRGDQTWATPAGGSLSDGDKGDVTVSSSGAVWTIDADAVTYAKMQDVSATDKVLGRSTAGAGVVEEIACTAAGRALLDDANAAAQRTTLGLGTAATHPANATPTASNIPIADGSNKLAAGWMSGVLSIIDLTNGVTGSGATVLEDSPTILTPTIADFTNAAHDHSNAAGGGLISSAAMSVSATDKLIGRSSGGAGASEEIACTAAGRAILDDADASAQRTTLGLGTMSTLAATARPMVVPMWARGDSTLTLTNMPAAEALVPSAGVGRMIAKVDLSGFTQVCLRGQRDGGTAATGCKLRLKYHTSYTTTVGTFSTIGTSEVQVTVDATGYFDSGWIDLVSGAKVDGVFIAMTQLDGDGASDPTFGNIYASFR